MSRPAMERLHETFVRLCEIRSPTGEEREVADSIAAELRALGLEVNEDDAAGPAEAGAGNLIARLPGQNDEWVMFCAHIDTVPHKGQIEVVESDGVFRSAGETILDQVEVVDVARTWLAAQAVPSVLEPLFQPGGRASPAA